MKADSVISLIGIATKAGKVASGEFMTEKCVKEKRAYLVIVAADSSENTKKKFQNMCTYYKVPYYEYGSKEQLGHGMGKEMRASLTIKDANLAGAIEKQLKICQNGGSKYGEN